MESLFLGRKKDISGQCTTIPKGQGNSGGKQE